MNNQNDFGSSMIETMLSSEAVDIGQDITEVALDALMSEGIVEDIPIIQTLRNIWKTATSIQNALLIKKILVFLREFDKTTDAQRDAFIHKQETNPKYKRQVGETIIMLLDRYDDHLDKPIILAKLFSAYIREEINYDKFLWLATAVERAFIVDIKAMLNYYAGRLSNKDISIRKANRNLYTSGLSDFYVLSEAERIRGGLEHLQIYSFNNDAVQLAQIVLGDQYSDSNKI